MKPKLSVVLPAKLGFHSVAPALSAWEAQSRRSELEILIPYPDGLGPSPAQVAALPAGYVLINCGKADLHEARALAIMSASADYVMLAEDHCVPDSEWTSAVLGRLEEDWDAVGSALRAGNTDSAWPRASFLLGYGEWMMPVSSGPTSVLCGWNGTIRTSLLRQVGKPQLTEDLLLGAFLVRRLRDQGGRFFLEEKATMRHFDPPGWARQISLIALVGLGFGALRTRRWPLLARLAYPLAFPAIALLHWKRAFIHYRRAGAQAGLDFSTILAAAVLAIAWALGESLGAWFGVRSVAPYLWRTEAKPVTMESLARSTQRELSLGTARA